jgi:cell division protein ZapB
MEEDKITSGNTSKRDKRRTILLIISVLLIVTLGIVLFFSNKESKRLQAEKEATERILDSAYTKLDSMSQELAVKIKDVEELGASVEELTKIKEQLEDDKKRIRKTKDIEIQELRDRVEGYTELLLQKDEEIAELKAINEQLFEENTDLKTEKEVLSENISSLNQERQRLAQKVALASRLTAENIRVTGINSRGSERQGILKSRQLDKLRVDFELAKNEVAPIGGKEIFLRVVDQNDNAIFDVSRGSGSFMLDGREEFYTSKKEILFDNTGQNLSFLYDKGSEYDVGNYTVEIYADGYMIGSTSFRVK